MDRRLVYRHDPIEGAEYAERLQTPSTTRWAAARCVGAGSTMAFPETSSVITCRSLRRGRRSRIGRRQTGWATKLPDFIFSSRPLTSLATAGGTFE